MPAATGGRVGRTHRHPPRSRAVARRCSKPRRSPLRPRSGRGRRPKPRSRRSELPARWAPRAWTTDRQPGCRAHRRSADPDVLWPPQMTIRLPVQTAICPLRASRRARGGDCFPNLDAGLESAACVQDPLGPLPPQTSISFPLHTAVWPQRGAGSVDRGCRLPLIGVRVIHHAGVDIRRARGSLPPQTMNRCPSQMAVCPERAEGAPSAAPFTHGGAGTVIISR